MSTWQTIVLLAMAGCAIGCLLWICRTMEKLTKAFFSIGKELTKINSKIEKIETVNREDPKKPTAQYAPDPLFEDLEAAIANFEKLKRIDLT